jgi:periplasmic divalent cation tolerance protein
MQRRPVPRRQQPIVSFSELGGAATAAYVQVTTATASEEEARQIARGAVERRLAACAQVVGPITSTYWWQGAIETAGEWLCVLKTTASRFEALAAHVRAEHSYDTPEITATPITQGSPDYLAWITAETDGHR